MKVLSLFGGIECGLVALKNLGIYPTEYYSSEIDPYAIKITTANHPEVVHIGDIKNIKYRFGKLQWLDSSGDETGKETTIDLMIGGSPCQDLSIANAGGKGLNGEKSGLFFEYIRLLTEVKPRYFLLENVASMKQADRDEITRIIGVEPIMINSSLVSAQNRKRLYWTNIPGVVQPQDKGIKLKDILEDIPTDDERWKPLDEKYLVNKSKRIAGFIYREDKIFAHQSDKKRSTVSEHVYSTPNSKSESLMVAHIPKVIVIGKDKIYIYRKLTPKECERLQTLPDDYTIGVSDSRRYKAIGNGWTVATIQHIFSFIPGSKPSESPIELTQESTGSSLSSPKSGSQGTGHEEE